jgi:hypothetical protein
MGPAPVPSLFYAMRYCKTCKKQTTFLPVYFAVAFAGRSQRTIYYWMERGLFHWRPLPSGRRLICRESLILPTAAPTRRLGIQ